MTLLEFNNMSVQMQSDFLMEWGYFITKRKVGNQNVAVFALEDFFVEIVFQTDNNNIVSIKGVTKRSSNMEYFSDLKKHAPFLECRLRTISLLESIHKIHPYV
jgi:hypothetical protein